MDVSRIHRLLRLIIALQGGDGLSVEDLMEDLAISRRTLFRDIKTLMAAKVPVRHVRGKGYEVDRDFFLPPVDLSMAEALGLMLLAKTAQASGRPLMKQALAGIAKLSAAMPPKVRDVCHQVLSQVTVDLGPQAGPEENRHYAACAQAVEERSECVLSYKSPLAPVAEEFTIEPYALHYASRAWYLFALSTRHGQVRTFKLTRFQKLEPTGRRFARPGDFTVEQVVGQAWQLIPDGGRQEVELEFSSRVGTNVYEIRWHRSQKAELLPDGRCKVRFEIDGLSEIAWWLCGYADQVTILAPAELRERVAKMHAAAAKHHGA